MSGSSSSTQKGLFGGGSYKWMKTFRKVGRLQLIDQRLLEQVSRRRRWLSDLRLLLM